MTTQQSQTIMARTSKRDLASRIVKYGGSSLLVACLSVLAWPLAADDLSSFTFRITDSEQPNDSAVDLQLPEEDEDNENDIREGRFPPPEAVGELPVREPQFSQPVTTVARQPSTVGRSPAAVFVIDQEMIRRSGARSVPELLRMVPGLHVARIDANKWSISSRGFSSRFARKLLVQIDGRVVYTPLFAGTFWDVQDLLLDDIERIEVIRGPGATIWGANAVNGIINIITKSADDTHGAYVEGGGGTEERGFAGVRVGGVTRNGVHWRVSGKWFERDRQFELHGRAHDDWRQGRLGIRADWAPNCCDAYTVQGDIYTGINGNASDQPPFGLRVADEPVSGGSVLGRWTRTFDEDSDMSLQVYYDRTDRRSFNFDQNVNTFDVDFQHRSRVGLYHNVIWGLGYRCIWDRLPVVAAPAQVATDPVRRTVYLASAFIQDEMTLLEDALYFTLGTKLSQNSYTNFEVQPTARVLWLPDERSSAWGAVSRAVRVPSRLENDGRVVIGELPPPGSGIPLTILGSTDLDAEETMAYEIGYRREPVEWFSWDLALFYNVDQRVTNFRPTLPAPVTFQFFNGSRSRGYGLEIAAELDLTPCWRISGWYSYLQVQFAAAPNAVVGSDVIEGGNPTNQVFLMSSWDLGCRWEVDLLARYVDNLPSINVPRYISLDARLAWRPSCRTEITVVGQNLLDSHHTEYATSIFAGEIPTEVQRGVYAMLTWEN
jgi:iron complex outermembrane receptor protein